MARLGNLKLLIFPFQALQMNEVLLYCDAKEDCSHQTVKEKCFYLFLVLKYIQNVRSSDVNTAVHRNTSL